METPLVGVLYHSLLQNMETRDMSSELRKYMRKWWKETILIWMCRLSSMLSQTTISSCPTHTIDSLITAHFPRVNYNYCLNILHKTSKLITEFILCFEKVYKNYTWLLSVQMFRVKSMLHHKNTKEVVYWNNFINIFWIC